MRDYPFCLLTFDNFPIYIFSSDFIRARRTRLWRSGKVQVKDCFHARDKSGALWIFIIEELKINNSINVQILGYPVNRIQEDNIREIFSRKGCCARIDTEMDLHSGKLFIHDIVIHPDYRRRHVGKFLVREIINYFQSKQILIKKITGMLGTRDESTEQDRQARDSFWKSLGFEVKENTTRTIECTVKNISFVKIKAHRITEREYLMEIENQILSEEIARLKEEINALKSTVDFYKNRPCLMKIAESVFCTMNVVIKIILFPVRKIFKTGS